MADILAGDPSGLTLLVERHHGPLLGYLYRLLDGDRALAEDLVQETFERVLRQRTFRPSNRLKPWLYAIATNLARDHFRAARRRGPVAGAGDLPDRPDPDPGPEDVTVVRDQARGVAEAIGRLAPEYRETLLLRFYQGLSLQEIAEALAVPVGTVKSRLSVGTRRLRDLLQEEGEETS
ncbi:MAG TPA: RNA polymerase sigma factor [Thermomicrobiaceae bacterium]|nr:RNA polymerase sigma factor [Thermomicrobiaceae bacterium]